MRSAERWTEPSSTCRTPRVSAICGTVSPFEARATTEVREMTLRPLIRASWVMISSVRPSLRKVDWLSVP